MEKVFLRFPLTKEIIMSKDFFDLLKKEPQFVTFRFPRVVFEVSSSPFLLKVLCIR